MSTGWTSVNATCAQMGVGFDRWQDGMGRLVLAKRDDGLYAADIFGMSITRQTGKTYFLGGTIFGLFIGQPNMTCLWTAHRTRTAGETFKSMQAFAKKPKIAPHILKVSLARGEEAVLFKNGSRILFGAREHGFGRGWAGVDVLIFDEAQILSENAMDDMVPATNTAPNPLIILAGTPPKPTDPGEVFTQLRTDSLSGDADDVGFIEISADRDADPLDRDQWRIMNPSYPHRTSERAILRMYKILGEDSFKREAMGIWDEVSVHQPLVKPARWRELIDVGPASDAKPDSLGVDMSHGMAISIGACWFEGDSAHVEEVWSGMDAQAATDWLVEHAGRAGRRIEVVIDSASPAKALAPDLQARKVKVRLSTAGDMAKACGLLVNRANADGQLTHGDQKAVTDALAGARRRPIRDAGGFGYDRRDPTCVIHPIVAVTLALLGAAENPRRGRRSGGAAFT